MPLEYFSLWINGQQRNTYHTKMDGWLNVVTGIMPGENTIVFRVENAAYDVEVGPYRVASTFGTGRVWLDDCEVTGYD